MAEDEEEDSPPPSVQVIQDGFIVNTGVPEAMAAGLLTEAGTMLCEKAD